MFEGVDVRGIFKPKEKPAAKTLDMTKYYTPFLSDGALRSMAEQISGVDIPKSPWVISLVFMAVKISALGTLYGMWKSNKENQLMLDKQAFSSGLSGQLGEDNEVN